MGSISRDAAEARCRQEIIDLHAFFDAWYVGRNDRPDTRIDRLERVLDPTFHMIAPTGDRYDRDTVIGFVRDAEASARPVVEAGQTFRIWTDQHELMFFERDLVLMNYIEWQIHAGDQRGRLSSVWLRVDPDAPADQLGVSWLHLHETWLPESE